MKITPRPYQTECLEALQEGRSQGDRNVAGTEAEPASVSNAQRPEGQRARGQPERPRSGPQQLVVLPTGAGKTIVAALDMKRVVEATGRGAIFLAHRDELIRQPEEKVPYAWPDVDIGVVQGMSNRYEFGREVTIASVQTVSRWNRLEDLVASQCYSILYVDEAHHAPAETYLRVMNVLRDFNPGLIVVGLTATPVRGDATAMATSGFDSIAYSKSILDLMRDGYLADVRMLSVDLDVDLDGVSTHAGDLKASELRNLLTRPEVMVEMVDAWKGNCGDRTLAFTVDVEHAERLAETFRARGVDAESACGETPVDERRDRFDRFQRGQIPVITNCMLLCLDAETEILTERGWTKIDEMSFEHKVANYEADTGAVTFEPPLDIVRRDRGPRERIVSLQTPRRSIRVTEGHRMLYRTNRGGQWHKKAARDLVGKSIELPVSTVTDPEPFVIEQEPTLNDRQIRRRISAQAYNLRKNNGYSYDASFTEARKRVLRRLSLCYAQPRELTLGECMLIGFWLGDGSKTRLQSGGIEFRFRQSTRLPIIIQWIDALLAQLEIDSVRRDRGDHIQWSLPRGTGGGTQQRDGLYRWEPYLDRSLPRTFWALDEKQFDALLHGLWMADGNHGQEGKPRTARGAPRGVTIYQSGTLMLSRLQSLAVCRGWRASLRGPYTGNIHCLSMTKRPDHYTSPSHALEIESVWRKEKVWCVRTRTSNLITRRNGSVTLMGNTEGYDDPSLPTIMLARPTKSQSLFIQMAGRGTRLAPGKERMTLLDFSYNTRRHSIVQLPHLFGFKALNRPTSGDSRLQEEVVDEAVFDVPSILSLVRQATEIDPNKPPPRAGLRWVKTRYGHGLDIGREQGFLTIRPAPESETLFQVWHHMPKESGRGHNRLLLTREPILYSWAFGLAEDAVRNMLNARTDRFLGRDAKWQNQPATPKQIDLIERLGLLQTQGDLFVGRAVESLTKGEAAEVLTRWSIERELEPATPKQIAYLRSLGGVPTDRMTKREAMAAITALKEKGW